MQKIRILVADWGKDAIVSPDSQQEVKAATGQGANHEPAAEKAQSEEIEQDNCARESIAGQKLGGDEVELTPLQHDALTRIYVMLVDRAEEAAGNMPADEAELVDFLQQRANLTIRLSAGEIEFSPEIDLSSRIDCLLHLISEGQILKKRYLRAHRLKLGQACDQIIELAHRNKATLEATIPTGGYRDHAG